MNNTKALFEIARMKTGKQFNDFIKQHDTIDLKQTLFFNGINGNILAHILGSIYHSHIQNKSRDVAVFNGKSVIFKELTKIHPDLFYNQSNFSQNENTDLFLDYALIKSQGYLNDCNYIDKLPSVNGMIFKKIKQFNKAQSKDLSKEWFINNVQALENCPFNIIEKNSALNELSCFYINCINDQNTKDEIAHIMMEQKEAYVDQFLNSPISNNINTLFQFLSGSRTIYDKNNMFCFYKTIVNQVEPQTSNKLFEKSLNIIEQIDHIINHSDLKNKEYYTERKEYALIQNILFNYMNNIDMMDDTNKNKLSNYLNNNTFIGSTWSKYQRDFENKLLSGMNNKQETKNKKKVLL